MDNNNITFTIKPEQLWSIGNLINIDKSQLSPFNTQQNYQLNANDSETLKGINVLNSDGTISNHLLPLFEELAKTKAYTRIRYSGGSNIFEYMYYFTDKKDENISIITTNDGLLINMPASHDEILDGLSQFTGNSGIRASDFYADVSDIEALVLVGLFDLIRKIELINIIDNTKTIVYEFSVDDILSSVNDCNTTTQSLVYMLRKIINYNKALDISELKSTIDILIKLKLIKNSDSKSTLTDSGVALARRLLVIDNFISVSSGSQTKDGEIIYGGFSCMQSGVNDLLFIENTHKKIELQSITSALILNLANELLNIPFTSKELLHNNINKCSKCGTALQDNAKFCQVCGSNVSYASNVSNAPKKFCSSCGKEMKKEAMFCSGCGSVVE